MAVSVTPGPLHGLRKGQMYAYGGYTGYGRPYAIQKMQDLYTVHKREGTCGIHLLPSGLIAYICGPCNVVEYEAQSIFTQDAAEDRFRDVLSHMLAVHSAE